MKIPIEYLLDCDAWFLCKQDEIYNNNVVEFKFKFEYFNKIWIHPPEQYIIDENDLLIDTKYAQKDTYTYLLVLKLLQINAYSGYCHPITKINLSDEDDYIFNSFSSWSIVEKQIHYWLDNGSGYKDEIKIDGYYDGRLYDINKRRILCNREYNIGLAFCLPVDDSAKYLLDCGFDSIEEI